MQNNIGRLLSILHRQSQIYLSTALKKYDLSSGEYPFLLFLYKKDGVTQDELSSYLYIDKAATTRAIQSLEAKNYVIKCKDDIDKRCNHIYLTEKAIKLNEQIKNEIRNWNEFLTENLDADTVQNLYSTLEEMVTKVEKSNLKKQLEET